MRWGAKHAWSLQNGRNHLDCVKLDNTNLLETDANTEVVEAQAEINTNRCKVCVNLFYLIIGTRKEIAPLFAFNSIF